MKAKPLYNKRSRDELQAALAAETEPRITISFYRYFQIDSPALFRDQLYAAFEALKVFGRIYVAHEGINAQLSLPESNLEAFKNVLNRLPGLQDLRLNIAVQQTGEANNRPAGGKSFWVLKIKVRDKVVADGISDPNFDMSVQAPYVNAEEFNKLTDDPNTIVVDMRNHYEYEVGRFENAIEVPSDTFREQLPMAAEMLKNDKDKNVVMYCTGGIRCEKASKYLMHHGFTNVFHLEGGIINYANKAKEAGLKNKFKGKNFVFDDRLGERISDDILSNCHQCGKPADTHTNCKNDGCHLLFIQCAECAEKFAGCCSVECAEIVAMPAEQQKELRKGVDKGNMIFNKSRHRMNALSKKL